VRLTIVGDGTERATLEAMAAPLAPRCASPATSQDEVAAILATADAFVLPSFAEGVPVVLMEALAAGLPVIATRITGVPELVEDGVSGLLVHAGRPEALAAAIDRWPPCPTGARLGAQGRETGGARSSTSGSRPRGWPLFVEGGSENVRPEPPDRALAARPTGACQDCSAAGDPASRCAASISATARALPTISARRW
jgi:hypothetical protein